ncbi:hypothetical protein, partial [Streptomyces sp. UNOC14_S4]|uniref:hypothetical protein n=1 Tax=Streptomyces sp. UNOC14_S4 TaxID=2872340 RepID=UPI0023B1D666
GGRTGVAVPTGSLRPGLTERARRSLRRLRGRTRRRGRRLRLLELRRSGRRCGRGLRRLCLRLRLLGRVAVRGARRSEASAWLRRGNPWRLVGRLGRL